MGTSPDCHLLLDVFHLKLLKVALSSPLLPQTLLQLSLNYSNLQNIVSDTSSVTISVEGNCAQPKLCPLNQVRAGTCVRIKQLCASQEVMNRLREMGFCEEQKVTLLSRQSNLICQVCNARLGISAQLAEGIMVETLTPKRTAA